MTGRPRQLPDSATAYKTVGPFDAATLPSGLCGVHRLKPDVWGLLKLTNGAIDFVWDDEAGGEDRLVAPAEIVIPPDAPHHLRHDGPFRLDITFHRMVS